VPKFRGATEENQGTLRYSPYLEDDMAEYNDRDEEFEDDEEGQGEGGFHTSSLLTGLVIGAVLGAGAALLFAPQSGEKTRRMLRKRGGVFRRDAEKRLAAAKKSAKRLVRERKEELLERMSDGIDRLEEKLGG
jgi:gas vesicle protein